MPILNVDTRIADRNAELSQTAQSPIPSFPALKRPSSPPPPIVGRRGIKPISSPPPSEALGQIRADLTAAQQERSDLQNRLSTSTKELETLKSKSKLDGRRIAHLSAGVTQMTVKMRDRDEELRGKTKLLEHVQDEIVTLTLQLNMAEEEVKKLRGENQELVDRWMARMGREADAMNDESRFA